MKILFLFGSLAKVSDKTDDNAKDSSEKLCSSLTLLLKAFTEGNKEKDSPNRANLKRGS